MAELIIRTIQPKQAAILKDLWYACFPSDSPTFVARFIQCLPRNAVFVVGELAGVPVTMACLIPATARFRDQCYAVRYLYAGCTHPKVRGKGYYRQLMEAARSLVRQMGESAIYLHPANGQLEQSYRRMGYLPGISGEINTAFVTAPTVSFNDYVSNRSSIINCLAQQTVVWDPAPEIAAFFLQDANATGVSYYASPTEGLVLYDTGCVEQLSIKVRNQHATFCLWIPTEISLLQQNMYEYGGVTGTVGD